MKCQYCDNEIPANSTTCPSCGAAVQAAPAPQPVNAAQAAPAAPAQPVANGQGKSRMTYILLGIFLGCLGIHNFYVGRTKRGIGQLLVTVLLCAVGGYAISEIWSLVDICTIKTDGKNQPLI